MLEVPSTFVGFHDEELIDYRDAALASESFHAWVVAHGGLVPLHRGQCVGYRIPLFLGGQDVIANFELADIEIYWSLCAQLLRQTQPLPPGTSISDVSLE